MTDKRSDIQALRALAVVAVVVGHMNPQWLPGGYLGVDMFFVISGFVITQILVQYNLDRASQYTYFWGFWLRRVFRIVPAYLVMMLFVATGAAIIFLPENFSQFADGWKKSLLFLSNQYFATYGDYFSPATNEQPLLHTWSLAVEMQFYLLFPFFIYCIVKLKVNGGRWIGFLAFLWLMAAQWFWSRSDANPALYYSLLMRVPEFLLGAAVAFLGKRKKSKHSVTFAIVGLMLIFVALIYVNETRFNPVLAAVACVGVVLILYANVDKGLIASVFNAKVLMAIGALSYSIYLWHWPILAFWRYSLGEIDWGFWSIIYYISFVTVLSWLSWYFIEVRFRRVPVGHPKIARGFALLVAVGVLPAAYGKALNSTIPPASIDLTRYADGSTICHGQVLPTCIRGVQDNPKALLIGDSHAAQLNISAGFAGEKLGIGIEILTASSCVPLNGFNVDKLPQPSRQPCRDQMAYVAPKIDQSKIILLAAMWSYQFEDPYFEGALRQFLAQADGNQRKVIVLGQIPKLTVNPQRASRLSKLGFDLAVHQDTDWQLANKRLQKILNDYTAVKYYDPSGSNIFATPPFYKSYMIYHDSHHINELGSKFYGNLFEEVLRPSNLN
jgi:peptidoglycan/LPS O-acetylase OafA/YrhL